MSEAVPDVYEVVRETSDESASSSELTRCGVAGCDYAHQNKGTVGFHRFNAHGIRGSSRNALRRQGEVPEVGAAGEFVCEECGFKALAPQGLGAHRRHAHGTPGTTTRPATPPAAPSMTLVRRSGSYELPRGACGVDGCDFVAASPAGMGSHRRNVHGIEGASPSTKYARRTLERQHIERRAVVDDATSVADAMRGLARAMFPQGIPFEAVEMVAEWKADTLDLITTIRERT